MHKGGLIKNNGSSISGVNMKEEGSLGETIISW